MFAVKFKDPALPCHRGIVTTELILDPTSGSMPSKKAIDSNPILNETQKRFISTWRQCTLPLPHSRQ